MDFARRVMGILQNRNDLEEDRIRAIRGVTGEVREGRGQECDGLRWKRSCAMRSVMGGRGVHRGWGQGKVAISQLQSQANQAK